ncbi:MAG: protein tyrosine phosphatase family protein [Pseudomonadota bacterium]
MTALPVCSASRAHTYPQGAALRFAPSLIAFGLLLVAFLSAAPAADAEEIINFSAFSPTFASSGQPTEAQLVTLRDNGLQRVVYIAYSDHERSLPNADRLAKQLGLEYIHIPVEWNSPTRSDFELFAAVMQQDADKSTLLHCQMNYRASAFAMLYRVLYQDVPLAQAKADMNTVWTPNETWTNLVLTVLKANGVNPNCEGCDWTPAQPQ